jgi:hypothetical protein
LPASRRHVDAEGQAVREADALDLQVAPQHLHLVAHGDVLPAGPVERVAQEIGDAGDHGQGLLAGARVDEGG